MAEKNNITITVDEETDDEKDEIKKNKKNRRKSSIYEMLPDFKNQVIIIQTHLKQIKMNVEEINNLKEQSNKIITPNKEKGKFSKIKYNSLKIY